jgi:predicted TIM-barrel fold metal-dependent hydrolase
MAMPSGIPVVDLMVSLPASDEDKKGWYDFMKPLLMDEESRRQFAMPAQYMFKDIPKHPSDADYERLLLEEMDKYGVEKAMIGTDPDVPSRVQAIKRHPDRLIGSYEVNPLRGMDEIRKLVKCREELGIVAATAFPAGVQVPINDKKFYPIYAKCVELDIPICVCAGVPGPRLPMMAQHVELIDEVCWYFPELKFVTRHGCEPWTDLIVKLMLKWPNLYYSTSAFAPRYYPKDILDFANTRGAGKVMFAGYFPMGLSYERIFKELADVPFKAEVWPKFLHENARRVFKL